MERFEITREVGDGSFGNVWRAVNKESGEVVAIKKMKKKYYSWEECMNLPEVKSLRKMNHPNIVQLKEVIRENDTLYLVFEYMDCSLYQLMINRGHKPFPEAEIRSWCFQIFQALGHMHHRGYFHRDLKPENLLLTQAIIKIADFGLAREISSKPPYTDYVSTRWYRAPEILLQAPLYSAAVDMWAMGAIIAELLSSRPLFPGSRGPDQMHKICKVLGTPDQSTWSEGLRLAGDIKLNFPQEDGIELSTLMPYASRDAINLISILCSWDPLKRPNAKQVLQHSFFQTCVYIPPSLRPKFSYTATPPSANARGVAEQKNVRRGYMGALPAKQPAVTHSADPVQRKLAMNNGFKKPTVKDHQKHMAHQRPWGRTNSGNNKASFSPTANSHNIPKHLAVAVNPGGLPGIMDVTENLYRMSVTGPNGDRR